MKDKVNYITLPLDAAVHFIRASSSVDAGVTTSTETDLEPLFLESWILCR